MGNGLAGIAPGPAELISDARDERRMGQRPETAVLIPSYNNPAALRAHLGMLGKQKWKKFDIIIIYGEGDSFEKPPEGMARVLHIREKGRLGCAGAYYLAERIALDEGYAFIIEADDDCLPESDTLIGSLADSASAGSKITLPLAKFGEKSEAMKAGLPHYYGCFRRECFEKAGLTFLPLHFGGEDIELMERMENAGFDVDYIEETVIHPPMRPVLINAPERSYYYFRGEIEAAVLSSRYMRAFATNATYLFLAAAQLAFGNFHAARMMVKAVWDASGMKFFQENPMAVKTGKEGMRESIDTVKGSIALGPGRVEGNGLGEVARSWLTAISHAGKAVSFRSWSSVHSMPAALLAKSAFIEYEGMSYTVHRNRNAAHIAAGIAMMAFALLSLPPLSLLLVFRGILSAWMKRPGSRGYGSGNLPTKSPDGPPLPINRFKMARTDVYAMGKSKVSIILPAYNEGTILRGNVERLEGMLKGILEDFEIIISEDGSTDGTGDIAKSLESGRIRVLRSERRLGKGAAIRKAAGQSKGQIIIFMDADLASNPQHVGELVGFMEGGADIVIGSRYLKESKSSRNAVRYVASRGFNWLVRTALGSRLSDHQCGFKAFRKERVLPVIEEVEDEKWFWDTELLVRAQKRGLIIKEIPIEWKEAKGSKFRLLRDTANMGLSLARFKLKNI